MKENASMGLAAPLYNEQVAICMQLDCAIQVGIDTDSLFKKQCVEMIST